MTRVLLVDDQPMIRAGLTMVLTAADDLEVVGELDSGDRIVDHVAEQRIDVVCMDVRMPGVDGIEATRRLVAAGGPPVCILTTFGEQDILWAAVEAGAAGFELKSATPENLIEAIRTVAAGGSWIDGSLLGDLLEVFRTTVMPQRVDQPDDGVLTDRELDVLRLMARGASNHEIADELFLATTTVKTHVGAIFAKLGVRDRAAAIVHAFDAGIVTPRRGR